MKAKTLIKYLNQQSENVRNTLNRCNIDELNQIELILNRMKSLVIVHKRLTNERIKEIEKIQPEVKQM